MADDEHKNETTPAERALAEAEARMRDYLACKPKDKHGVHVYDLDQAGVERAAARERFEQYQRIYAVPSED